MEPAEMIGLCKGTPDAMSLWIKACLEAQKEREDWIAQLRRQGVAAAHPDDGWVNREKNEVYFAYTRFNDGVDIGSRVALGWHDKYRIVKIVGKRRAFVRGMIWWKFEEEKDNARNPVSR